MTQRAVKDPLALGPEEIGALPPDGGADYNRLVFESSPYLLQHASNPVDWHPWGPEAFERARSEQKPVFLSIGYATCHWCHVMERESFEDPGIAELLNRHFIPVKVDREERPDIDQVYMAVTQGLTGRGGWPMTVLLTPEGRPFFAGTYIPPTSRGGLAGMREVLPRLAEAWEREREKVVASASEITDWLRETVGTAAGTLDPPAVMERAFAQLRERFDDVHGGFGERPKFPTPHNLTFLLRYWKRTGQRHALEMVTTTLQAMRRGGIFDQVGFGFHRYSTDRRWLVPHFEKMLYDQALMAIACLDAWQATGEEACARTAREVFDYVLRDLALPGGGFCSAEDADSEGEEGTFYLWTVDEIRDLLADEADLWLGVYGFEPDGNFREERGGRRPGANIPHLRRSLEAQAAERGLEPSGLRERLERARRTLLEARDRRVRPLRDDKVLTDWNGLMIAALAIGARRLQDTAMAGAAVEAARLVWDRMRDAQGRLLHRYRAGTAGLRGLLDDHAFLAWGLLELYQTTFDAVWLERACGLAAEMVGRFSNPDEGGFFLTPSDGERLVVRGMEIHDGALPSGNAVACDVLARLARITGRLEWEEEAQGIVRAFGAQIARAPSAHTHLLGALDFLEGPSSEIVLAGDPDSNDLQTMLGIVRNVYAPNRVVLLRPEQEDDPGVVRIAPWIHDLRPKQGRATAYVCRDRTCDLPITEADTLREALLKPIPRRGNP